jgi:hypothetical protein
VVLLGQNVNSYWDQEALSSVGWRESRERLRKEEQQQHSSSSSGGAEEAGQGEGTGTEGGGGGVQQPYAYSIAEGFTQRVRVQSRGAMKSAGEVEGKVEVEGEGAVKTSSQVHQGDGEEGSEQGQGGGTVEWQGEGGVRFAELLSLVASIDPDNMRIRFQSPHPKDFPNEVTIISFNNIIMTPNIVFYCMRGRIYFLTVFYCFSFPPYFLSSYLPFTSFPPFFLPFFLSSFLPSIHLTSSHSFTSISIQVLNIIAATPNICNSLHMPAQHGSSSTLDRMQRGYSREVSTQLIRTCMTWHSMSWHSLTRRYIA